MNIPVRSGSLTFRRAKWFNNVPFVDTVVHCVLAAKVKRDLKIRCSCHNFHMCTPCFGAEQLVNLFTDAWYIHVSELVRK